MNDCQETRRLILSGQRESILPHLETCASCAAFAEAVDLFGVPDESSPLNDEIDLDSSFDKLQTQIKTQFGVRRFLAESTTNIRSLIVGLCALITALLVYAFKPRVDLIIYPLLRWIIEASSLFALALFALVLSLRPLHRPRLSPPAKVIIGVLTVLALAAPLLLPIAHTQHTASLEGIGTDLASRAMACFVFGTIVVAGVAVAAFLASRGGRGISALPFSLWLALGVLAQLILHIHCPIVQPLHIGLGHSSIVPFLLAAFALLRYFSSRGLQIK